MKKIMIMGLAVAASLAAVSCNQKGAKSKVETTPFDDSITVAMGTATGKQISLAAADTSAAAKDMAVDKKQILAGMREGLKLANDSSDAGKSYMQGITMGMQLKQMAMQYKMMLNVNIDDAKFVEAFEKALNSTATQEEIEVTGKLIQELMQRAQQR